MDRKIRTLEANSRFQGNGSTSTVGGMKINRNSGLGGRIAAGAITRVTGEWNSA